MDNRLELVKDRLNIKLDSIEEFQCTHPETKAYLLNNTYVVKFDKPSFIAATVEFLQNYQCDKLVKLITYSYEDNYVVYTYIKGDVSIYHNFTHDEAVDLMTKIFNFVSGYPASKDQYGHIEYKFDSWLEYLLSEANYCAGEIPMLTTHDLELVKLEVNNLNRFPYKKMLMHGDLGVHNLVFKDKELIGIFDPQPIVGDPLYDYFSCYVSSPELMQLIPIDEIFAITKEKKKSKLKSLFLITLYSRIRICIKYHPSDLDFYLKVFDQVTNNKYHYFINNMI